jgi:hypothetical protein
MSKSSTTLPVLETVQVAWEKVYGAKATFWAALGIILIASLVLGFIEGLFSRAPQALQFILTIGVTIIQFLLNMGLIYIGIKRAQDKPITYKQMFYPFTDKLALKLVLLYILQILVFLPVIGILLLGGAFGNVSPVLMVITGIIAVVLAVFIAVRIALSWAFVIDNHLWPVEAIRASFRATRSHVFAILAIYLIVSLLAMACIIPAFLSVVLFGGYGLIIGIPVSVAGLIWVIPLGMIIYGLVYKKLTEKNA